MGAAPTGQLEVTRAAGAPPERAASRHGETATGGSASSQATDLDARSWTPRPGMSVVIRTLVFLAPLAAGFLAVQVAIRVVPRPAGVGAFIAWVVGLMLLSFVVAIGAQRVLRVVAPLRTLFTLSLVFPDNAPSRFSVALKSRTARRLAADLDDGREISHQEAARATARAPLAARTARSSHPWTLGAGAGVRGDARRGTRSATGRPRQVELGRVDPRHRQTGGVGGDPQQGRPAR